MLSVKIPNKFSHDLESNNEREREISIHLRVKSRTCLNKIITKKASF